MKEQNEIEIAILPVVGKLLNGYSKSFRRTFYEGNIRERFVFYEEILREAIDFGQITPDTFSQEDRDTITKFFLYLDIMDKNSMKCPDCKTEVKVGKTVAGYPTYFCSRCNCYIPEEKLVKVI